MSTTTAFHNETTDQEKTVRVKYLGLKELALGLLQN